jgi:hypothetical protein
VAFAACSDEDARLTGDVTSGSIALDRIPPEQRNTFADGVVTLQEYTAAFAEFEACANSTSLTVVNVTTDPATGLIQYGTVGELTFSGPDNGSELDRCYRTYFSETEATWQTTDPAVVAQSDAESLETFKRDLQPCLEANGYEVPDDIASGTQQFGDLSAQAIQLINDGVCVVD